MSVLAYVAIRTYTVSKLLVGLVMGEKVYDAGTPVVGTEALEITIVSVPINPPLIAKPVSPDWAVRLAVALEKPAGAVQGVPIYGLLVQNWNFIDPTFVNDGMVKSNL